MFGTHPFKEGRSRRSAPTTDFQVAFSHCTQAYLLYSDEDLGETWGDDKLTDCYEGLTKLQELRVALSLAMEDPTGSRGGLPPADALAPAMAQLPLQAPYLSP